MVIENATIQKKWQTAGQELEDNVHYQLQETQ
jgi:hypothetical protein